MLTCCHAFVKGVNKCVSLGFMGVTLLQKTISKMISACIQLKDSKTTIKIKNCNFIMNKSTEMFSFLQHEGTFQLLWCLSRIQSNRCILSRDRRCAKIFFFWQEFTVLLFPPNGNGLIDPTCEVFILVRGGAKKFAKVSTGKSGPSVCHRGCGKMYRHQQSKVP